MTMVMNYKNGVGCTLLAYNLGKLFNLPINVDKDNFMIDDEHKFLFPEVSKITATKKHGIFDSGARFENRYSKKFIKNSKLIIIPFEYGYESMEKTIETIKHVESITYQKTPILLILNRLDKQDSDRDFNYTGYMKDKFLENGINFNHIFNDDNSNSNIYLTYLRNSYSLQSNLEFGEYFLDKMYNNDYIDNALNNLTEFRSNIKNFDYRFFLYLASSIISRVDYTDEETYIQDKDMVMFRNNYISNYINIIYPNLEQNLESDLNEFLMQNGGVSNRVSLKNLTDNTYVYNKETKLIKDMAYISCLVDTLHQDLDLH